MGGVADGPTAHLVAAGQHGQGPLGGPQSPGLVYHPVAELGPAVGRAPGLQLGQLIGDIAFVTAAGVLVWLVSGRNGENVIRAEGPTQAAAWRAACAVV
jgi:hypothetical protein